MPTQRTSLNVSLTPELSAFIAADLASGRYQTASEVVRAALRLLTRTDPPMAVGAGRRPRLARADAQGST